MLSLTVKQHYSAKNFSLGVCVFVCARTCIYGKFPPHGKSLVIYTFLLSNLGSLYN